MKIFAPSGYSLRDYCYINLLAFDNHVKLLKGGNVLDRIKLAGLRNHILSGIKQIKQSLYGKLCFNYDDLKSQVTIPNSNGWDDLLTNTIIWVVVNDTATELPTPNDQLLDSVLFNYAKAVQERHTENDEILMLKNMKMVLEIGMDLILAEGRSKYSKTQFQ